MKLLGAMLVFVGALGGYVVYRRSSIQTLHLARTLSEDLAVLRCQICVHRKTLPSVLSRDLGQGAGNVALWSPLQSLLDESENPVRVCWETASQSLPEPLERCISPLGALLPAGGEVLACAIDEVRRELLEFALRQQEQQPMRLRLAAAICLSSAALFVLVCV